MARNSLSSSMNQGSPLLSLAAELRNRIWEYLPESDVPIDANLELPPWTRTCRQIREEALPIWLLDTTYTAQVTSKKDIDTLIAFESFSAKQISSTEQMHVEVLIRGELDVPAVMHWRSHVRRGGNFIPTRETVEKDFEDVYGRVGGSDHKRAVLIVANLKVAKALRGCLSGEYQEAMDVLNWSITMAVK